MCHSYIHPYRIPFVLRWVLNLPLMLIEGECSLWSVACLAPNLKMNSFTVTHAHIRTSIILRSLLQMDFPAGYGNAIVSYIALLVLCYMGQNIDSAVFCSHFCFKFKIPITNDIDFLFILEWIDLWCTDQYEMVLFAIVQTKRCCSYVKSHSKWCCFNAGKIGFI